MGVALTSKQATFINLGAPPRSSAMSKSMSIGDAATATGLAADTIR